MVRFPSSRLDPIGFTLIELLVVLAIVALLLTIAAPRYFGSLEASRETVLRENLRATRETIDKFRADSGRWPNSIQELVDRQYLRAVPIDPLTDSSDRWALIPPKDGAKGEVADLRSTAPGKGRDGSAYGEW